MAALILNIDRADTEVTYIACLIDTKNINEYYSYNPAITDEVINTEIRADLSAKGYIFD